MIVTRAPLRIPLGGGGTDLPAYYSRYGGSLIAAAINKYVYVVVNQPPVDGLIRLKYSESETVDSTDDIRHLMFREALEFTGVNSGIEIATMADAPAGTGLGSSGSFTVALLMALHAVKRESIASQALAEEACDIEMNRAGMTTGKQDQYLAALGGFVCLDIDTSGKATASPLTLGPDVVEELRSNMLLFYTGKIRKNSEILQDQEKDTQSGVQDVVESLHTTKEIGLEIKAALKEGRLEQFGELLHRHWENKKVRSRKISDPQIDMWYEVARENGALGGKVMGAGGSGFFMFYCPNDAKSRVREALAKEGLGETAFDFDLEGAKVLVNI